MDPRTLTAYDDAASTYAADWRAQPTPSDMHALLREHFRPGPTMDVGCGAGRDTAWLAANGFPARGVDASAGLLREARLAFPGLRFDLAALPGLAGVQRDAFENVLCETVIMHLAPADIAPAVASLRALLRPGGTLYLSWRVTAGESVRDAAGRLYAAFDARAVHDALGEDTILLDREELSVSSGKRVHRLIARRAPAAASRP